MRLIDADALMIQYELIGWYSASKSGGLMRGATSEDNPVIHYYDGEEVIKNAPTIEAEPVRHGEWDSKYDEHDGFYHHFCTECKNLAIFAYDEQDDYDEGMDGEWYLLGKNIVGIKENLTDYCPNCGAKMDGESDE